MDDSEGRACSAGRPPDKEQPARPPGRLPWWLAILLPLLGFAISSVCLIRVLREIDEATRSIVENGGPSVVHLATEQTDIRRIEMTALRARPEEIRKDREKIAALEADLDHANVAYREAGDYPGELEAYLRVLRDRAQFYVSVDCLLDRIEKGYPPDVLREMRDNLVSTADVLSTSMRHLILINANGVVVANDLSGALRRRAMWLTALSVLFLGIALTTALLGRWAARKSAAHAEDLRRLEERRVEELDAFAGRVAHDLRDVLGIILMRASLGERAGTFDACRQELHAVVDKSRRMDEILTALLNFARAAGRADPDARCDVCAVVLQVVAEVRPLAAEAGAEIVVEPMPPHMVACDAAVLSVVFANLVRNAVKHTGRGPDDRRQITVREREGERHVRVEVEDTGPGLPPGAEQKVFEPFVRMPEAKNRAGAGLGLATVKRLVEANGGQVGVVSAPGAGARFWFTLPLREA